MSEPEAVVDQAKALTPEQIASFYHTDFYNGQVAGFKALVKPEIFQRGKVVVDIGGGLAILRRRFKNKYSFQSGCLIRTRSAWRSASAKAWRLVVRML